MVYHILLYILYLSSSLTVIFFVGRSLFVNGIHFLINCFHGDGLLAKSTNKILLTGYYLINMGYVIFAVKVWEPVTSFEDALLQSAEKSGMIFLCLGLIHLFNMSLLLLVERIHLKKQAL
ncbi:MAG TPA: hypothetical protein VI461_05170 [Chitinophagaceae bacterium]|nr:hypothetical protein [Chitinophagaceae bacterium]